MTRSTSIQTEGRSIWWWLFCMPGAVVMWFRYMSPHSVSDSFGTARRRNVVLFQFLTTMVLYAMIYLAMTHMDITREAIGVITFPFRVMFHLATDNN